MIQEITRFAPTFWEKIKSANSILINLHVVADQDSIGSALGLKHILENLGKTVTVFSPEPIGGETTGTTEILTGFKDILIQDILDFDLSHFDLFVCLDTDGPTRLSRRPQLHFPLTIPTVVIDHHAGNEGFGELNLVIGAGFCVSELIYWLCQSGQVTITPAAAQCLFIGILFDTGQFRYPGPTSSDTYRAVSELIDIGKINFPKLIWESLSRKNSLIKVMGIGQSRITEYFGGKVLLTNLTFADLKNCGLAENTMNTVYRATVDSITDSKSSPIVGIIYQIDQAKWGISLRCNNPYDNRDVSAITRKISGGGGHPHAAGASPDGNYEQVLSTLLLKIQEAYPELGNP